MTCCSSVTWRAPASTACGKLNRTSSAAPRQAAEDQNSSRWGWASRRSRVLFLQQSWYTEYHSSEKCIGPRGKKKCSSRGFYLPFYVHSRQQLVTLNYITISCGVLLQLGGFFYKEYPSFCASERSCKPCFRYRNFFDFRLLFVCTQALLGTAVTKVKTWAPHV